jgi:anaerobic nitric oxide reductase transcription regulator
VPRGAPIVLQAAALGPELAELGASPAVAGGDASPPPVIPGRAAGTSLREAVEQFERDLIRRAVAENGGNWAAAARALRMDRGNLHNLARRLGLR